MPYLNEREILREISISHDWTIELIALMNYIYTEISKIDDGRIKSQLVVRFDELCFNLKK